MNDDDRTRVQHMLEAGEEIAAFIAGRSRADLEADRMLLFAVVRAIEILGEAASRVSAATRAASPEIPWSPIVGMRNRVVHAYWDIDRDVVWNAVSQEVPALVALLRNLLAGDHR